MRVEGRGMGESSGWRGDPHLKRKPRLPCGHVVDVELVVAQVGAGAEVGVSAARKLSPDAEISVQLAQVDVQVEFVHLCPVANPSCLPGELLSALSLL